MEPVPGIDPTRVRNAVGAAVLHANVTGRAFPPGADVEAAADASARDALDTLADIHEVRAWDRARFKRAVLHGSMAAWRPGLRVYDTPGRLRVVMPMCPIGRDVDADRRACAFCQHFQRRLVERALDGQVDSVKFARLIARGDAACEMDIRLHA